MIEINNATQVKIDEGLLVKIAEAVFKKEGRKSADVSVGVVGEKKIRQLNKKYRKKDKVADVLSFEESEFGGGEIIICPSKIRKDAAKYGITFTEYLIKIFIHGLLHLLHYDHVANEAEAEEMEAKENKYLRYFCPNPL